MGVTQFKFKIGTQLEILHRDPPYSFLLKKHGNHFYAQNDVRSLYLLFPGCVRRYKSVPFFSDKSRKSINPVLYAFLPSLDN